MSALLQSRWAPKQPHPNPSTKDDIPQVQDAAPEAAAASTLSAVAHEFSPAVAEQSETSAAFEFAQTGSQEDNLFEYGIIYESMQTRSQDDLFGDDFIPAQTEEVQVGEAIYESPQVKQSSQRTDIRGRGRGRGGTGNRRLTESETQRISPSQAPENAPTGPKKETQSAVRGDRHATGGVKKPKLSEAELSEKMAQISIKNASLTAAHARAEADAASFEQREAQAKVDASQRTEAAKLRAKEERRDRQQMIGEREKNRMRKLNAMNGREWDAEKNEDDFTKGGKFDRKGGFAGDQTDYTDGREYLLQELRANGATKSNRPTKTSTQKAVPTKEDFPALPSHPSVLDRQFSNEAVQSWADQVESSV